MSVYENIKYKSFNSFFVRKKKKIDYVKDMNFFISPCDAKLTVYDVNEYSCFEIKNSFYSVKDLLNDDEKAQLKKYLNEILKKDPETGKLYNEKDKADWILIWWKK